MKGATYAPPAGTQAVRTIDVHAAGEPLRVIVDGLPPIPGATMLDKRRYAQDHLDVLRRRLMWEPRGHADMYGAIPTDPVTEGSDCGVLFLHNEGFSTMCGHGIIGLTKVLVEAGLVPAGGRESTIRIDTPAGLVVARAAHPDGTVRAVSFVNVPSFVYRRGIQVEISGIGAAVCDIAFGGAYYAFCDATELGLSLAPSQHDRLVEVGRQVKQAVLAQTSIDDPVAADLGFLYGVIFTGPPVDPRHHSRHVCIFAEGEVDRSPTGTGVSGRAALLHDAGRLDDGETIVIESILGTCFGVSVVGRSRVGPLRGGGPRGLGRSVRDRHEHVLPRPGGPPRRRLHLPLTTMNGLSMLIGYNTHPDFAGGAAVITVAPVRHAGHPLSREIHMKDEKSRELFERLAKVMPGANTRTVTHYEPYPVGIDHGEGCRLWDVDGNPYIDLINNYTALIHGHAHPRIVEAVTRTVQQGLGRRRPGADRPAGGARRAPLLAHAFDRPGALHQLGHRGGHDGGTGRARLHRQGSHHHAGERLSRQLGPGLALRHR